MQTSPSSSSIEIPTAFKPLFQPYRYKVYYGGRGGAKSWNFARALLIKGVQQNLLVLCTREFQGSILDSVHRLLCNQIEAMGLSSFYTIQQKSITGRNGTQFIFEGLKNNVTKIKSMEGVDIVWCEEAENISAFSWDVLIPTIRKKGSEIWLSFNPADELDETYQRYVINPPANALVKKVTWRDNPWFPEELEQERLNCKQQNERKYLHIWEGEPNTDYADSIILPEWVSASIDAHKKLGFKPKGVRSLGFDPADIGEDQKAIAFRHGAVVQDVQQWSTGDVTDAIDKAFNIADDKNADFIVYDSIGIGAAVKMALKQQAIRITVDGFCGAERPRNPNTLYEGDRPNEQVFRNQRAQFWWYIRDRFEKTFRAVEKQEYIDPDELISLDSGIPDLSKLKAELCRVQRKRGQNSFIQLESKQEMVSRGVKSPNMADALVMCFANPEPAKMKRQKMELPRLNIV